MVIVDNLSNSEIGVLEKINELVAKPVSFYKCDLRDKIALSKIFETHSIDAVIHFAGFKAVGESCEKPFLYYDNNVLGSIVLYELMVHYGVKNLVFSSSCVVYDSMHVDPPYTESTPLKTINPYASTKLMIEIMLQDLTMHLGFRVIALRYFNPIGAHPSGKIGESPR